MRFLEWRRTGFARPRYTLLTLLALPALAQTTTSFNGTISLSGQYKPTEQLVRGLYGTGAVGTEGNAVLALNLTQSSLTHPDYSSGTGPLTVSLMLLFNSLDRITLGFQNIQDPGFTAATVGGTVNANSTGAYAGATADGSIVLTLTRTATSPLRYNLSLSGSANVGGKTVSLAIVNVPVTLAISQVNLYDDDTGTCAIPAIGSGNLTIREHPDTNKWDDNVHFLEESFTCSFSSNDSVRGFLILTVVDAKNGVFQPGPITIAGGTGRFSGATGIVQVTNVVPGGGDQVTVSVSGNITEAGPATPIITSVTTANWVPFPIIAQNGWIQIKGTNLVPANTPAGGTFWSNAPEFAQGRMPTELGGVSVTVNGKPAYVWWFCSKATTPACSEDQINVLTPLDDYEGQVMVAVKNGSVSSGAFQVLKASTTPSLLRFSVRGDAVATHLDGSLLGPTTLYPGLSTPGRRGETVSLWAIGFGLPTAPLVQGSATQTGSLPFTPACFLGGTAVQVAAALVSPGLYLLNITIPDNAVAGDNLFYCTIPNNWTLGALIAVQ
jgi:uncharacterized protein (TIGR03437 family)